MKKKTIALIMAILAVVLCFTLAACGDKTDVDESLNDGANVSGTVDPSQGEEDPSAEDETPAVVEDLAKIKDAGKMIVGITIYEPMNYWKDEAKTELTGFDTEFALAVGEKLGVEIEFVEINWDRKFEELDAKTIDCVWNGMTITEEALANASVSDPYIKNAQVLVMKEDKIADYKDTDSIKDLAFAAEAGSAGEAVIKDLGIENCTAVLDQAKALLEVKSGAADACVIDITMAKAMTGEGTSNANLTYGLELSTEEYGIACRKNSDLAAEINKIMAEMKADGTLQAIADKYELNLAD